MAGQEEDYRPKSPDLNFDDFDEPQQPFSLLPPHTHPQQQPLRISPPSQPAYQSWYQQQDYTPHGRSYSYSASAQSPSAPYFHPPYSTEPQSATAPPSYLTSPAFAEHPANIQQSHPHSLQQNPQPVPVFAPSGYHQPPIAPLPYQPSSSSCSSYVSQQHGPQGQPPYANPEGGQTIDAHPEQHKDQAAAAANMPPRRAAAAAAAAAAEPPAVDPSPVKTKFPTARIKRIMQNDEEVGKVAQQTPIAVGKALEMFMTQLVTKSAEVARDKNSKRVTPAMLKAVIEADDQWDFLRDIASKVEPDKEGGGGGGGASKGKAAAAAAKAETDSDEEEEEEEEEEEPKPARRRGGRKKRPAV
ncbi:unnamed protein product [Discula destructiva]